VISLFSPASFSKKNLIQFTCLLLLTGGLLASCKDSSVYDRSKSVPDNNWSYKDKKDNYIEITDTKSAYNLFFNVRITNNYKYSNLFVLLHIFSPKTSDVRTNRLEFKLASPDGQWLGAGSGTVYSYRIPFAQNVKFDKPGVYNFQLEQNMREQPLSDVVDAGLRIEKVQ